MTGPESKASEPSRLKLVLVNFSGMGADLLRVALAQEQRIHVSGSATDALSLAMLLEDEPAIALIASGGVGKEWAALSFLEQIAGAPRAVRSIVIFEDMSRENGVPFLYRGARGLVCQAQADFSVLVKCILCVHAGQVWANAAQLEQLLCSLVQPRAARAKRQASNVLLSRREEQVLQLLAQGLSNRDLARTLKLSEHTIKNHLFRIFDKLGVSSRVEAVLYAMTGTQQEAGQAHTMEETPAIATRPSRLLA